MAEILIDSYVEIYVVRDTGEVESYREIDNAFRCAMHIWMALAKRYDILLSGWPDILDGFRTLWASIARMEEADQWVMAMTFDRVIIPKEHLETLRTHLGTFLERSGTETLRQVRDVIKEAQADDSIQGLCFNHNDAAPSFWVIAESDEERRPYNLQRDNGHWFLTPRYLEKRRAKS